MQQRPTPTDAKDREEDNVDEQFSQCCPDSQLLVILDLLRLPSCPQCYKHTTSLTHISSVTVTPFTYISSKTVKQNVLTFYSLAISISSLTV